MGKIEEEQALGESLGFGFGHVKFEMPVRYSGGAIEEAAGYIHLGFRRYIYVHWGVVCVQMEFKDIGHDEITKGVSVEKNVQRLGPGAH